MAALVLTPRRSHAHIALMRRTAALLALTALSWSQLAGFRCDMGTPAPGAGPLTEAPVGHHHPVDEAPPEPHGEHHGAGGGCLMILAACAAASARTVQAATLVRFPAIAVRANLDIAPIPVAVSMGVETPPPRHHA